MNPEVLDEIDRGILHLLQKDARNHSAAAIAEEVDVTANTVRNRIRRLEEEGIVEGYAPLLDYERADFQVKVAMICTAPSPGRTALAEEALDVAGVVEVRELMTGKRNVIVTAVAAETERMTEVASALHDIGLAIEEEELVKNDYAQPFDHFGIDDVHG